jgi:hypothetical protein
MIEKVSHRHCILLTHGMAQIALPSRNYLLMLVQRYLSLIKLLERIACSFKPQVPTITQKLELHLLVQVKLNPMLYT